MSFVAAILEAIAILALLAHPLCRRHKDAVPCLLLFFGFELCELVLWAEAAEGVCDELNVAAVRHVVAGGS